MVFLFAPQGHDNFGHSIPELLERNPSAHQAASIHSVADLSRSSASSSSLQQLKHCPVQSSEKMSPLPMHSRPLLGRRLSIGIDILIWIFCKLLSPTRIPTPSRNSHSIRCCCCDLFFLISPHSNNSNWIHK